MSSPDLSGTTALVTGASSGIGAAMARRLALWGCDLILTARRADRLAALASELTVTRRVACRVVPEDLSDAEGAARLHRKVRETGRPIDILINNAGFATYRSFAATGWKRHAELLQLNVLSLAELTHRFLPDLVARPRRTHILNVSSIGAWIAVPNLASYGASKACVLSLSEALAAELAHTSVRVTCLCPGGTTTESPQVAGQSLGLAARAGMMSAERCAAIGLRGMLRGRRVVVPGASNKLVRLAARFLPGRVMGAAALWILGPSVDASGPLAALPPTEGRGP